MGLDADCLLGKPEMKLIWWKLLRHKKKEKPRKELDSMLGETEERSKALTVLSWSTASKKGTIPPIVPIKYEMLNDQHVIKYFVRKYRRCNIIRGHQLHKHKSAQTKPIHSAQFTRWNGYGLNRVNPSYCSRYLWYAQSIKRHTLVWRLMGITAGEWDEGSSVSHPIGILCWIRARFTMR